MNSLCVVLMLMWLSNGQVMSSAIPINMETEMSLRIEGLDSLKGENEENIQLRMALELSSGDQRTPPKAIVENIQDDSIVATTTPRPTTTTTTTTSPKTTKECKSSFIRLGDQCYYFSYTQKTWLDASNYCSSEGADLVHPMSAVEDSLIATYLKDNHKGVTRWWIGGTDQYDEGRWVWAHDKSPMTYTNWVSYKSNYNSFDCAYYEQSSRYKWDDHNCANRYQFICQKKGFERQMSHGQSTTKGINGLSRRLWLSKNFLSLN